MTGTRRDDVLTQLTDGIAELTTSQAWARWLSVQARFPAYSFGNCLLIAAQRSDATRVAGYRAWASLGRQVRRGEKALWILAPITRRPTADDAGGDSGGDSDSDGRADVGGGTESGTDRHDAARRAGRVLSGFRPVPVFDVAQTEGEPSPEVAARLSGDDPGGVYGRLVEVAAALGYTVEDAELSGGCNGDCAFGPRRIRVEARNGGAQRVKTLAHELGHALLHESVTDRALAECEAESVAFVVCRAVGVDSGGYSFGYVAGWAGGGEQAIAAVRACGNRISRTAARILTALAGDAGPAEAVA